MELSNYLVNWVVTYLENLQPTYIGVIIYLLSSMDIPVVILNIHGFLQLEDLTLLNSITKLLALCPTCARPKRLEAMLVVEFNKKKWRGETCDTLPSW